MDHRKYGLQKKLTVFSEVCIIRGPYFLLRAPISTSTKYISTFSVTSKELKPLFLYLSERNCCVVLVRSHNKYWNFISPGPTSFVAYLSSVILYSRVFRGKTRSHKFAVPVWLVPRKVFFISPARFEIFFIFCRPEKMFLWVIVQSRD